MDLRRYSTFLQEPTGKPGEFKKIRALMMPNKEWQRVTMYLKKAQMEKEEAHRKFMEREKIKETSAAIQMEWRDSILTVQSRRIAAALKKQKERDDKERKKAEANAAFFEAETLKELAISHQQRKYQTENFRNLSKALRFSEVLKEQEMQRELNKVVKSWEQKREDQHVQHVLKDIEEFNKEEQEKAEKLLQIKLKYKEELMAQLKIRKERAEKQKKDLQEKEKREAVLIRTAEQMYEIALKKEKQEGIDNLINQLKEHREIVGIANQREADMERKKDKILELHNRIQKLTKEKIEEKHLHLRKAQEDRKEKIRQGLMAILAQEEDTEAQQIQNSLKQEEARLEKIRREREEFDAKVLKDRKDSWKAHLQQKADQKAEDELETRLSFAQRRKREEINELRCIEVRENDKANREHHKQDLLKQMQENKQKIQKTEDMDEAFRDAKRKQVDMDDEEYITFAENVIEEAKTRGWPTVPLLKAHELEMLKMGKFLKRNKKK